MLIYLIRHAIAIPRGTPGIAESDRPLTLEGIRKMRRNARGLRRLGVRFDAIWSSPLPRARQTADLLAEDLAFRGTIKEVDDLRPGADFRMLARELSSQRPKRRIALVGHEPDMGEMAAWLMTGMKVSALRFKKGGVACIEAEQVDPPSGNQLLWLLTPGQMSRLGRTSRT